MNEIDWEKIEQWCEENDCQLRDVHENDENDRGPFIFEEIENGNPGEDGYSVDVKRVYILEQLSFQKL